MREKKLGIRDHRRVIPLRLFCNSRCQTCYLQISQLVFVTRGAGDEIDNQFCALAETGHPAPPKLGACLQELERLDCGLNILEPNGVELSRGFNKHIQPLKKIVEVFIDYVPTSRELMEAL